MKKILLVLIATAMLLPLGVKAEELDKSNYSSKNLEETFEEEEFDYDLGDYKETDDQITIYMFRGTGCTYCRSFLTFLNSIVDEYGKYFKLESYEVWYDSNNSSLLEDISSFRGDNASGVPYIIIGDQTFMGYSSEYDDQIKDAITTLYDSDERYDIFEEMAKEQDEASSTSGGSSILQIVTLLVLVVMTFVIILFVENRYNNVMVAINEVKNMQNKQVSKSVETVKNAEKTTKVVETKKVTPKAKKNSSSKKA